jgi:phospholipase D1/2
VNRSKAVAVLRLAIIPALVAAALIAGWKLGYFDLDHRRQLAQAVERIREAPGVHIAFIAIFTVGIALCLPSNVGTWLAGALFGVWVGAAAALAGGLAATVVGYWLARSVAKRPMQRLFGEHRLLRALRKRDDIATLFQLRVLPVAPFAVLTYVGGLAGVSLRKLLFATVIGGIPACLAHAFVGTQLMLGLTSTSGDSKRALLLAAGVTLLMLLMSFIVGVVRKNDTAH